MTVILPLGRTFTRQSLSRSNQLFSRFASSNSLLRVSRCNDEDPKHLQLCRNEQGTRSVLSALRSYATAAASKPVGRPKAHTGRAAPKKTTKTKATGTKKKTATKTKAKAKPKSTTKAAPKKRTRKSAPSPTSINRARLAKTKDLKSRALLTEPKQLPANSWTLYFSQHRKGVKNVAEGAERTKETAEQFKHLSPEEREQLNHTANQNKAKNISEYKKWLSQHTPAEIKAANAARRSLNNEKKAKEGKKKAPIRLIKDDRLVKQPRNAYSFYTKERFASGDYRRMTIAEAAKLLGKEWKALSASEKQPFESEAAADMGRYHEEYHSVYGKAPPTSKPKKTT